jgi:hypothetical protein
MWTPKKPLRRAPPKPIVAATYVPGLQPTAIDQKRRELEAINMSRSIFPDGNVGPCHLPMTVTRKHTNWLYFSQFGHTQDPCEGLGVWTIPDPKHPHAPRFTKFPGVPSSVSEPAFQRAVILLNKSNKAKLESQNLSHLAFPKGNVSFFNFY